MTANPTFVPSIQEHDMGPSKRNGSVDSSQNHSGSLELMVQKTLNVLSVTCVVALATVSVAHEDDPKATQERTPYEGPSWRSDIDGGLAGGFDFDGIGLLANLTMPELDPGQEGADCWGYVSPSGREYALMTTTGGTSFVEITNPGNPQIIQYIDGANCSLA